MAGGGEELPDLFLGEFGAVELDVVEVAGVAVTGDGAGGEVAGTYGWVDGVVVEACGGGGGGF